MLPRRLRSSGPLALLVAAVLAAALLLSSSAGGVGRASAMTSADRGAPTRAAAAPPRVRHVFVINIENEGAAETYGPDSPAPYLAKTLRSKGIYLPRYYGIAHASLGNYLAQISGQGPNPTTQADCRTFAEFEQTGTDDDGQALGSGCVFPAEVGTLPVQMSLAHLSWKGYMEDMAGPCQHPVVGQPDGNQRATKASQYATRHNPFMYFHRIIDTPAYCRSHVVPLTGLAKDLRSVATTPNLTYITPDLCSDGHDTPCVDGRPGGLKSVNAFMRTYVPKILASPAFKQDGLLVLTADESERDDSTACCGEIAANTPNAGIDGPGGGVIGTVLISPFIKAGSVSRHAYNHYSLLGSVERIFGLPALGYAAKAPLFGTDVYNGPRAGATPTTVRVDTQPASRKVLRGHAVRFHAVLSPAGPSSAPRKYRWDFHDGGAAVDARGARVSHHWSSLGRHRVTLTVSDATGLHLSRTVVITVVKTL